MYSFEGDFRRKPTQSFGGASKKEQRGSLLQRAQDERRKREELRKRQQSALQIQSFFRGCLSRAASKLAEQANFDTVYQRHQKLKTASDFDMEALCRLMREIIYFYRVGQDDARLLWLCQQLIRQQNMVAEWMKSSEGLAVYQMKHILTLCIKHLNQAAYTTSQIASPLRMLEIYLSPQLYESFSPQCKDALPTIVNHLILNGYYAAMRLLVECCVPSGMGSSVRPPTPLAASLLGLISLPLSSVADHTNVDYKHSILRSLCMELFCQPFSEQIQEFLLPALAYGGQPFPFVDLLPSLLPICQSATKFPDAVTSKKQSDQKPFTPSIWLLYALLTLADRQLDKLDGRHLEIYLKILQLLIPTLHEAVKKRKNHGLQEEESSSDDDQEMEYQFQSGTLSYAHQDCLRLLDSEAHVRALVTAVRSEASSETLTAVCSVCHALMAFNHLSIHKTKLLYSLAFNPSFVRNLWHTCLSITTKTVTGSETPLLQMLSRGLEMSWADKNRIVPLLSVFCSLFSHSLTTLHDSEFYGQESHSQSFMPFRLGELVPMTRVLCDACLGVVELAHPESKPTLTGNYRAAFQSVGASRDVLEPEELNASRELWAYLFKVLAHLVKQLYSRDSRHPFCPRGHWLASQLNIYADTPSQLYQNSNTVFVRRPFGTLSALNPDRMLEEEGPPLSNSEVRKLTILTELPFVVPFAERVKVFHKLVSQDKSEHQGVSIYTGGPHINIQVRRNFLYEDAFERLSPDNEPNLKLPIRVQLKNFAGLDEAGIDGGGIFREFMTELMKTAFDPNRGFFQCTTDKLLYPNPQAQLLVEGFTHHYYFLGRILGKAMYENMLVELPFASFFLSKILSTSRGDVDIHHLASLDPQMYKNLLFLKTYDGDVSSLDLDFTVINDILGETKIEELKPGGRDIPVTNQNRIEYIHLMADYRLNRQIRNHCAAFRQGLADVISLDWLRMFDHNELQVLISGAHIPIDLEDLKKHTNYSGGYTAEHQVIRWFWEAIESFTDVQKRQLLKFVTSCSRPPLLGFKDLYPAFCVHYAGRDEDRLPTASTCMNLLKLPEFSDFTTLKQKLVYAIESGAGFELS